MIKSMEVMKISKRLEILSSTNRSKKRKYQCLLVRIIKSFFRMKIAIRFSRKLNPYFFQNNTNLMMLLKELSLMEIGLYTNSLKTHIFLMYCSNDEFVRKNL